MFVIYIYIFFLIYHFTENIFQRTLNSPFTTRSSLLLSYEEV